MIVYLRAKFQVSNSYAHPPPPSPTPTPTSKRTPKKPTQIRVKWSVLYPEISKNQYVARVCLLQGLRITGRLNSFQILSLFLFYFIIIKGGPSNLSVYSISLMIPPEKNFKKLFNELKTLVIFKFNVFFNYTKSRNITCLIFRILFSIGLASLCQIDTSSYRGVSGIWHGVTQKKNVLSYFRR